MQIACPRCSANLDQLPGCQVAATWSTTKYGERSEYQNLAAGDAANIVMGCHCMTRWRGHAALRSAFRLLLLGGKNGPIGTTLPHQTGSSMGPSFAHGGWQKRMAPAMRRVGAIFLTRRRW